MTAEKVIQGGLAGIFIGGFVSGLITLILFVLFKSPSGAVVDYSFIFIIFVAMWGGFSGAIVGGSLLREIESIILGIGLTLGAIFLLFLTKSNEIGFSKALEQFSKDASSILPVIFALLVISAFSSFVVSFFVSKFINKSDEF